MTKLVLDVGNCGPDHTALARLIEGAFDAKLYQSHGPRDTMAMLVAHRFSLVLVNRKLDQDYSDGLEIIKMIKAKPEYADLPIMLITNYPDHQQLAIDVGATYGFGKLQLAAPETRELLKAVLDA